MYLQHSRDQVDDPVVQNARASVERRLASSIEGETGLRDLHDEGGVTGVAPAEVAGRPTDDAEVRLRLRHLVERQGQLHREEPSIAKVGTEGRIHPPDRQRVTVVLGL